MLAKGCVAGTVNERIKLLLLNLGSMRGITLDQTYTTQKCYFIYDLCNHLALCSSASACCRRGSILGSFDNLNTFLIADSLQILVVRQLVVLAFF